MTARSAQEVVRNPLLALPAAQALMNLPRDQRLALKALLREMKAQAKGKEVEAYAKRKGPMTAYWMAVGTYAGHLANVMTKEPTR